MVCLFPKKVLSLDKMPMEKLRDKEKERDPRERNSNVIDKRKFLRRKKKIIGMLIIFEGIK